MSSLLYRATYKTKKKPKRLLFCFCGRTRIRNISPEYIKTHKIKGNAVNTGYNGLPGLVNLNQRMLYLPPFGHNMDTVRIMAMREGVKIDIK